VLRSAPLVAFVATARPEAARAFYAEVLGLELASDDQFALVFNAGGTMLRLAKVEQLQPAPFTVLGWLVDDIGAVAAELGTRDVQFERYGDWMQQDAHGIWAAPGGARVAWFKDPDGNTLSITQPAPSG
jgi:catechol 2,3-dioxygenase-like lactoylglutathione lyase family enzyme